MVDQLHAQMPCALTADEQATLSPRDWSSASRAEIVAWCEANGKNPALFLNPEPPQNPQPSQVERMTANTRNEA